MLIRFKYLKFHLVFIYYQFYVCSSHAQCYKLRYMSVWK